MQRDASPHSPSSFHHSILRLRSHAVQETSAKMNASLLSRMLWNLNLKTTFQSVSKRGFCAATAPHSAHLENDILVVPDGMENHHFPAIWLRDNCQCSKCFSKHAKARLVLMRNLDLDMIPTSVEDDGSKIKIRWPDGHDSAFNRKWLLDRSFTSATFEKRKVYKPRPNPKLWQGDHDIMCYDFEELMGNNEMLLKFLITLQEYGISLVKKMPAKEYTLDFLCNRIGFAKTTHYGTHFAVKAKQNANNLAYTTNTLGMHCDLPYYLYNPGVQFLHCIEQCELTGGENEFTDGFHIAKIIQDNKPEDFKILSEVNVDFWDVGVEEEPIGEFHKVTSLPTIMLDNGTITRINYNNQVRDSVFQAQSVHEVKAFYQALSLFDRLAYETENHVVYKLKQGDCIVFDNQRILHGRKGYTLEAGGFRHLQGTYVDWDEINSKVNALRESYERCQHKD